MSPILTKSASIATLRGPSALQMVRLFGCLPGTCRADVTVYDEPLRLLEEMSSAKVEFVTLPTLMEKTLNGKGYSIAAITIWGGLYLCCCARGVAGVQAQDYLSFDIHSLRDKTVHSLARGMAPDMLLRHILDRNGLTPEKDVSFDYSCPTHRELLKAAMENSISFCVLPEPLLSQALNANPDLHIVADLAEEWMKVEHTPLPLTALFVNNALVGKDVEKAVAETLRQSSQWVNSCPEEAAALAVRYGICPDEDAVRRSIQRSAFKVVPFDEAEPAIEHFREIFTVR